MLIGKPGAARTAISAASSDRITVRGLDLVNDLMGRVGFTDYVFLLATGRAPTDEQRFFLDLSLVALAEHGLTPSVQAARMTYDADPAALQAAIAAGVLGCGAVILGTADLCRKVIEDVLARVDAGGALDAAALEVAREYRERRQPLPGYGHPLHKPVDPRAERMIALARERGIAGRSVEAALALTKAAAEVWGKPLPMNVSMTIAATLRDAGRSPRPHPRRADPRPHGRAHRPLHGGGGDADRLPDGLEGRGSDRSYRRRGRAPPDDRRARHRAGAVGGAGAIRRAALSQADRISVRALALLSRQARARRLRNAWRGRRPRGDRRRATDRKGRAEALALGRRADRVAPDRFARGDRAHLFDQRHDRNAELYPAHRRRPRSLGAHVRALLRGLRLNARRAHRLDL